MRIDEVTPTEVKDLDITQFFKKKDKKIIIQIKHFSTYQRKQIIGMLTKSQKVDMKDNQMEVENLEIQNTDFLADAYLMEMESGVVKATCPFEKWDKGFIDELDNCNNELTAFIHNAIKEMNPPLAIEKKTK